ncbi:MAG: magnesium transporter CorA, partial [Oscillospiraceae bacterium]|nr:magnesium transporter CorA [Oscillospiraceae bacterium]
ENDNNFFKANNLRYSHLVIQRIASLHDMASSLRDYSIQVRDLYQSRLDVKQNRIMTVLTVVTTVLTPLTVIAGWYGMNFVYMPELSSKYGYPAVIILSILIVAVSLIFFKKKKWL